MRNRTFEATRHAASAADKSGFRTFSQGDLGQAHDLAHRLLDHGLEREGYLQLGAILKRLESSERADQLVDQSEWIHLQWHMAVFEIAVGKPDDAHERFRRHILPQVPAGRALTDAPSLLWRLHLADLDTGVRSDDRRELEWGAVRDAAVVSLAFESKPYVILHNLLAVAGARDVLSIDRWLDSAYGGASRSGDRLLLQIAWGLRTFANGDFEPSRRLLAETVRRVSSIGGSAAQNELFVDLSSRAQHCSALARAS